MLREMKTGMIVLSIGYLAIGLLLLIMPETSLQWICYAFGAIILISGAVNLIRYLRVRGRGFRAYFMLISGVAAFALGIFLLLRPDFVMGVLPVVFGLFILLDGILRVENSVELAGAHGRRWWLILLLGLLSIGFALLLIFHPLDSLIGITMLCGLLLVIEGALNLGCIIYASMELRTVVRTAEAADKALSDAMEKARSASAAIDVPADEIVPAEEAETEAPARHGLFGRRAAREEPPAIDAEPVPAQAPAQPAAADADPLPDQTAPALSLEEDPADP